MNFVRVRDILLLIISATICSSSDDGLLNVECHKAQDCYVLNGELELACWYGVNKCKCYNTMSSNFNLKWENDQCLMSKYGPCGGNGNLYVGCQDGFVCVDSQCRNPSDTRPEAVRDTPYRFTESNCIGGCSFGELSLTCDYDRNQCQCEKVYVADISDSYWDMRNYDGNRNCSVGKFGPCGTKNGITIECHGDGITCVSGTCLDANQLTSDVGEDCATQTNCREGLLCSQEHVCIVPFSLPENKLCDADNECQEGLQCRKYPDDSPFNSSFCTKMN